MVDSDDEVSSNSSRKVARNLYLSNGRSSQSLKRKRFSFFATNSDSDENESLNTPKKALFGSEFDEFGSPAVEKFLFETNQSPLYAECSGSKRRMVKYEDALPSPPVSPMQFSCKTLKTRQMIDVEQQNIVNQQKLITEPGLGFELQSRKNLALSKRLSLDEIGLRNESLKDNNLAVNKFKKYRSQADSIKKYLDEEDESANLIADFSAPYILPVLQDGKHSDLKAITHNTLTDVLLGKYDNVLDSCTIIDCRYPYEYEGGHIMGARNFYTKDSILSEFILSNAGLCTGNQNKNILVFHCEFSSERGPKMCRFLRNKDREINENNYPHLFYPEIYLLENGYKEFFHNHIDLCYPALYKPMLHEDNSKDLIHFRAESKLYATKFEKRSNSRTTPRFSSRKIVKRIIEDEILCKPLN
ncbi:hypothetical protein HELRODRAFT_83726 [Helobdella robusta]|uniref:M-phase inducer phosphatase n=1 Tax=Helobdella robusta TaxID=6412 RepID=T1G597_HELRO|nr:hypothetical protein HELRODRAFT_83726 [Helobdella robusta]ESO00033.1 hypothetical protein HELRODRAFT_83726 [Helobdella robusta]